MTTNIVTCEIMKLFVFMRVLQKINASNITHYTFIVSRDGPKCLYLVLPRKFK